MLVTSASQGEICSRECASPVTWSVGDQGSIPAVDLHGPVSPVIGELVPWCLSCLMSRVVGSMLGLVGPVSMCWDWWRKQV